MNNRNIELIRDSLAGAVIGAICSLILFVLSILNSILHFAGNLIFGNISFSLISGQSFVSIIFCLIFIGASVGFTLGYYATQDDVVKKNISKWLKKYNK